MIALETLTVEQAIAYSDRPGFAMLLTPDGYSPKTDKGHARNVATAILYLAPSDASGVANTCTDASEGCRLSCLYAAGRGGFDPSVPAARIARTKMMKYNRFGFNARLIKETESHRARAARKGMQCAERPNGTSDLPWENFRIDADGNTLMSRFPGRAVLRLHQVSAPGSKRPGVRCRPTTT